MDYKYIEQLLERYWECQTTLEEEAILRTFFAQTDIPARLLPYRDIFAAQEQMMGEAHLGEEFDERLLAKVAELSAGQTAPVRAVRATLSMRLAPFYKATAVVAIMLTLGMAAQHRWTDESAQPDTPLAGQLLPADSLEQPVVQQPALAVQQADTLLSQP